MCPFPDFRQCLANGANADFINKLQGSYTLATGTKPTAEKPKSEALPPVPEAVRDPEMLAYEDRANRRIVILRKYHTTRTEVLQDQLHEIRKGDMAQIIRSIMVRNDVCIEMN